MVIPVGEGGERGSDQRDRVNFIYNWKKNVWSIDKDDLNNLMKRVLNGCSLTRDKVVRNGGYVLGAHGNTVRYRFGPCIVNNVVAEHNVRVVSEAQDLNLRSATQP